jgi:hypothetical protein
MEEYQIKWAMTVRLQRWRYGEREEEIENKINIC